MAVIDGHLALATLLTALAGGLNAPPANWSEIDILLPAAAAIQQRPAQQTLDQRGYLADDATPAARQKIAPADFFRIVELAPKATRSPDALKAPPEGAESMLHIKTSEGQNYYFAAEQERIKDGNAQEIWTILRKYRSGAKP